MSSSEDTEQSILTRFEHIAAKYPNNIALKTKTLLPPMTNEESRQPSSLVLLLVVNREEQFSICAADRENPLAWQRLQSRFILHAHFLTSAPREGFAVTVVEFSAAHPLKEIPIGRSRVCRTWTAVSFRRSRVIGGVERQV